MVVVCCPTHHEWQSGSVEEEEEGRGIKKRRLLGREEGKGMILRFSVSSVSRRVVAGGG